MARATKAPVRFNWASKEPPTCWRCEATGLKWRWSVSRRESVLYDPVREEDHTHDEAR